MKTLLHRVLLNTNTRFYLIIVSLLTSFSGHSQGNPTLDSNGQPFDVLNCDFNCTSNDLIFIASNFFASTSDGSDAAMDSITSTNCSNLVVNDPIYLCVQIENANNGTREPLYFAADGSYGGTNFSFSTCFDTNDDPAYSLTNQGEIVTLCSDVSFPFTGNCGDAFTVTESLVGASTGGLCTDGDDCSGGNAVFQPSKCNGIASFDVSLPVELMKFSSKNEKGKTVLNWITASEINFSHFEVEYSTDAKNFKSVGKIYGRGNSLNYQKYEYEVNLPQKGYHYFRLKMVDLDDSVLYSAVEVIQVSFLGREIGISPSPFKEELNISTTNFSSDVSIQIFNLNGRLLLSTNHQYGTEQSSISINTSTLTSGIYFLKIFSNELAVTKRIVKN